MHFFVRGDPHLQHGQSGLPFRCLRRRFVLLYGVPQVSAGVRVTLALTRDCAVSMPQEYQEMFPDGSKIAQHLFKSRKQSSTWKYTRDGGDAAGCFRGDTRLLHGQSDVVVPRCAVAARVGWVIRQTAECGVAVVISFFFETYPWHQNVHRRRSWRCRLAFLLPSRPPQGRQCARK